MNKIDVSVIEAAQNGCKTSLALVTEQTKAKVFTFLYRMTLNYHLSEDLCQETMLNLIKSIHRLHFESEEALWAWLFRTAQGKVQHHRRSQANKRIEPKSLVHVDRVSTMAMGSEPGPVTGLFRKEMVHSIFQAIETLRIEYRSVIILRCMNELSYTQIAAILGGTQLRNKMLFFRAKRALRQELTKKGLGRSHFLGALLAFASVTSLRSQEASGASLVNVGLLKVSMPGILLSAVTTKLGIAAAVIVLILGLITGGIAKHTSAVSQSEIPDRYANLASLLQEDYFAYPSSVVSTWNPNGDGFMGINASQTHPQLLSMACADVLVGKPNNTDYRLILPERRWIEVGFDGPIVDGPGPDLFYTGWYCPIIQVFLTDGARRVYELPRPTCHGHCDCFHIVPFDISGLTLPFEPKAIRVQGIGSWYRYKGFELTSVRARVEKMWP